MARARLHLVGTDIIRKSKSIGKGSFQHDYRYKEVALIIDARRKIFKDSASEKSEQINEVHSFLLYFTVDHLDPDKLIHMIFQTSSLKLSRI